ncbi:hypothetical protein PA598K_04839 [Paenibacillus sp. 598K]|uniref:ADP-ribosylglycohydrolase family protein n=1 Tax=Paenibacillus sp. 598K TaxID=1117987 RepID=UPI000FFA7252|nr:ADP-ribosylglycohydrolase family protein [Paenibacillus sp. 598K]GBF76373.1 hypothetical protein PA598K_04839 [Paenibacillus sp. 598K]
MKSHRKTMLGAGALLVVLAAAAIGVASRGEPSPERLTLSRESYYDKTLAAIVGQVGGVLTGYEFISEEPLPDDWFGWIKGPYSGQSDYRDEPWNDRIYEDRGGIIGSDDDYHIDFFNQHILDVHGPDLSAADILAEWLEHDVSDWGGGGAAMEAMRTMNMLPPFTGRSEWNPFHWATESYIENDTLGLVAPGMPMTAYELTERFASVSGDSDPLIWARFQGALYALAYFETDARVALEQAAELLPRNSWPYEIYAKVVELHAANPDDWRWAQGELREYKRLVYGWDNIQVIPDINNALGILAILYGGNDYTESAKIASLAGYDADCTASFVMGLMGIIKGMEGTPAEVKDAIYQDGQGRYFNDKSFTPHIRNDYPELQTFVEIAELYQRNAERMIVHKGGVVEETQYRIPVEAVRRQAVLTLANGGFEAADLQGWQTAHDGDPAVNVYAQDNGTAFSGDWNGRVDVDDVAAEGRLYQRLTGLKKGQAYRLQAYLTADANVEGRLFVQAGGQERYASVVNRTGRYASRTVDFVAAGKEAEIGLHAVTLGGSGSATIDHVTVELIGQPRRTVYEAEAAEQDGAVTAEAETASSGRYATWDETDEGRIVFKDIDVKRNGHYLVAITYAQGSSSAARLDVTINGAAPFAAWFPQTGLPDVFAAHRIELPVQLQAGTNRIELAKRGALYGKLQIDAIEVSEPIGPVWER